MPLPKKVLNRDSLRKMKKIDAKTNELIVRKDVPKNIEKRIAKKQNEHGVPQLATLPRPASEKPLIPAAAVQPPPAQTSESIPDIGTSSTAPPSREPKTGVRNELSMMSMHLDSLSDSHVSLIHSHEMLSTFVHHFVAWQGGALARMAAHLGIIDFPHPPVPFSQPPPPQTMPPSKVRDKFVSAIVEGEDDETNGSEENGSESEEESDTGSESESGDNEAGEEAEVEWEANQAATGEVVYKINDSDHENRTKHMNDV